MRYKQDFKIGLREINLNNKITNYGYLAFMQDISTNHSDLAGFGVKDNLTNKRAWILLDWYLEVYDRPEFGETLHIETCSIPVEKITFQVFRDFEIYDSHDKLVAKATSRWVLYDREKEKIIKVDSNLNELYKAEGSPEFAQNNISKLLEPEKYESKLCYTVKRGDIDVNNHVNNLNYLKFAYEVLPEDIFLSNEANHLRITYKNQIRLGANINLYYLKQENKNIVSIKSEDDKTLHSIIEMW